MYGRNCRLWRRKVCGAYLHGGGAQHKGCRYSSSVRDTSRRDHRNADGVGDLRQERKQAGLAPYVLGQKHFRAVCNNRHGARGIALISARPVIQRCLSTLTPRSTFVEEFLDFRT